ncbi:hypothetical protein LTR64_003375 [Lithohypha guttulata]|uniref:uncharacterized protein n=1 Tax=Lithohypha guttulata TaxID=1690604 RepID=UPI00315CC24D
MLHEILLSLAGLSSPIWDDLKAEDDDSLRKHTSPAEREMLQTLAELADLHSRLREATSTLSSSHPSPTCRAVTNRIATCHLRRFVKKVVDVETLILQEDAQYVGAYKIVPLSTIVTEFQPWARPLRWLSKLMQLLQSPTSLPCSAAKLFAFLHKEGQTGYTDIKDLSGDLLITAQQAWVQSLTPWLLYGQLPNFGAADFMIHSVQANNDIEYILQPSLIPYFITTGVADAILAVGKTLNQIKSRLWSGPQHNRTSSNMCTILMPASLNQIKALSYPLQPNAITHAIESINDAISQAALSHLLPMNMILDFLTIAHDYVLLRKGEFSASLIKQAEECLVASQATTATSKAARKPSGLEFLTFNEADVSNALSKTWSELSTFLSDHEFDDPLREKASSWLRLKMSSSSLPISTLLPRPASLVLELPNDSPLHIFVSSSDLQRYSTLNAYLVSLRRAEAQLAKLWAIPAYRRYRTIPTASLSTTRKSQQQVQRRSAREDTRNRSMRTHWACASQVLFLLSETSSYFHGEVLDKNWNQLQSWLWSTPTTRPTSSQPSSRPTTASSKLCAMRESTESVNSRRRDDPRIIAIAHRRYLEALYHSLLLSNEAYINALRSLLNTIDHFVALFRRLQAVRQSLDLQLDEEIPNALPQYAKEEQDLMAELSRTNSTLASRVHELVTQMREADKQYESRDLSSGIAGIALTSGTDDMFEPVKTRTLDRLLMKLDSLATDTEDEVFEDALINAEDD